MDGGKLSEINARIESRRLNELVSKFKMAASDLVSVLRFNVVAQLISILLENIFLISP